jgi:hypothetical protein
LTDRGATAYLDRPTPARAQDDAIRQIEQRGETGRQRFCPYETSVPLIDRQWRLGSFSRSARSVSSGVRVLT